VAKSSGRICGFVTTRYDLVTTSKMRNLGNYEVVTCYDLLRPESPAAGGGRKFESLDFGFGVWNLELRISLKLCVPPPASANHKPRSDERSGRIRNRQQILLIPGIWDLKVGPQFSMRTTPLGHLTRGGLGKSIFLVLVCLELGTSLALGSWSFGASPWSSCLFMLVHACSCLFMLPNRAGGRKFANLRFGAWSFFRNGTAWDGLGRVP
jgi:hypothetical protein